MEFNWRDRVDGQDYVLAEDINTLAEAISELNDEIPTKTSDLSNDSDFVEDSNYVHTDNNYTDLQRIADETIASNSYITFLLFTWINGMPITESSIRLLGGGSQKSISVGDLMCVSDGVGSVFIRVVNIYSDASVEYSSFTEFKESLVANKIVRLGLYDVELISDNVDVLQIDKYVNTIVYLTKNAVNYPTKEEMNTAIAEGDPKYELIQTITVANDGVTTFTFDKDLDGNSFKLDAVVLYISCGSTPSTSNYWKVGTTSNYLLHYFKPDSGGGSILLRTERMGNGVWAGLRTRNSGTNLTNGPIYGSQIGLGVDYVETIYMQLKDIPAASTITVYGRRVNK